MVKQEFLDIVDKNGKQTGMALSRDEVHRAGLLHQHVHVWIYNSHGEILLQRRSANKKTYANMWAMAAEGHVKSGRTLAQTVCEEVSEELGIVLQTDQLDCQFSYLRGVVKFRDNWIENGINCVFILENNTPIEEIVIQNEEVSEVKWMSIKEYQEVINKTNREYRSYGSEWDSVREILAVKNGV